MRILIYGAGVLGSYLAHVLVRGGNDVTVLARGERIEELNRDGIIIRHSLQFKTTVDKVQVISSLQPENAYDLIFVVMLYSDIQAVLPILANNQSRHIVFVGNNPDAKSIQHFLREHSQIVKQIAFGFQLSGGWREKERVICIRGRGSMNVGGLEEALLWHLLLEQAFEQTNYRLVFYDDIDAWLKSHIISGMMMWYAGRASGGDLRTVAVDRNQLRQMINALDEGFKVLEANGIQITPISQVTLVRNHKSLLALIFKLLAATPLIKLVQPMANIEEMLAFGAAFNRWKHEANLATPNWDTLEKHTADPVGVAPLRHSV